MAASGASAGPRAAGQEVRLACAAMRTRFELLLRGEDEALLRAAGEEALEEVHATEAELSRFRKDALCARVNREAARGPVHVSARFLEVLACCRELAAASGGAFEPTRARGADAGAPLQGGLEAVHANPRAGTVRFLREDVELDFGGIGKGVALDRARAVLADAGVTHALLHGGTSTTLALGGPWQIAIPRDPDAPQEGFHWSGAPRDEALSVSRAEDGRTAAARVPLHRASTDGGLGDAAARSDAWSTALLAESKRLFTLRQFSRRNSSDRDPNGAASID